MAYVFIIAWYMACLPAELDSKREREGFLKSRIVESDVLHCGRCIKMRSQYNT